MVRHWRILQLNVGFMERSLMQFLETTIFTKRITELIPDESYKDLQFELIRNPKKGPLIRKSCGLRKIRWQLNGRGKRGGLRIIYYIVSEEEILMLFAYKKNKQENLTDEQVNTICNMVNDRYEERKMKN